MIRDEICAMPNSTTTNIFILRAPMGFGKTIVGLSVPFADPADPHRYIYIVPPAAFDTWVTEVVKVFGAAARSVGPSTQIVFAHSSVPQHNTHAKNAIASAGGGVPDLGANVRAVITTSASGLGAALARTWATRAILDEAHATTGRTWDGVSGLYWIVGLSANIVTPLITPYNLWRGSQHRVCEHSSWVVAAGVMEGVVPIADPCRMLVAPWGDEARQFGRSQDKKACLEQNIGVYVTALMGVFAGISKGHVVLYLPDGDASEAIVDAAPRYAASWQIIKFINAVSKIRQFEKIERSILIAHHARTVAINIHATHLIVIRPDWVNAIRYAQLIGRVLRPLSPTSSVGTYLIMPHGIPMLRVAFAEALRVLAAAGLQVAAPELSPLEFLKAEACLQACGGSIIAATPIELLAVLGVSINDPTIAEDLFARWATSPVRTLTETHMRGFLGLGRAKQAELTDLEIDALLEEL
jgi:hypothetical protein